MLESRAAACLSPACSSHRGLHADNARQMVAYAAATEVQTGGQACSESPFESRSQVDHRHIATPRENTAVG